MTAAVAARMRAMNLAIVAGGVWLSIRWIVLRFDDLCWNARLDDVLDDLDDSREKKLLFIAFLGRPRTSLSQGYLGERIASSHRRQPGTSSQCSSNPTSTRHGNVTQPPGSSGYQEHEFYAALSPTWSSAYPLMAKARPSIDGIQTRVGHALLLYQD